MVILGSEAKPDMDQFKWSCCFQWANTPIGWDIYSTCSPEQFLAIHKILAFVPLSDSFCVNGFNGNKSPEASVRPKAGKELRVPSATPQVSVCQRKENGTTQPTDQNKKRNFHVQDTTVTRNYLVTHMIPTDPLKEEHTAHESICSEAHSP